MKREPLIFLDIDGVLNDHTPHANGYCGTKPECVRRLNWILYETDARIVLSSAWRYLAHGGSMTLAGLENLFLSHGLDCRDRIIGITPSDEDIPGRGRQIRAWMNEYGDGRRYVVIDDLDEEKDMRIAAEGHPFVQTDGMFGLTDEDAERVIGILGAAMCGAGESTPGGRDQS